MATRPAANTTGGTTQAAPAIAHALLADARMPLPAALAALAGAAQQAPQPPPTDAMGATTARPAAATVAQVSGALAQMSQQGPAGNVTTLTLHLAPPALGQVAIRISAPAGASPVVTITASHQASAEALATARPALEASLLRAGLPADTRIVVHQPNTSPSGGDTLDRGARQQGGQPRRPTKPTDTDTAPNFAETLDISA